MHIHYKNGDEAIHASHPWLAMGPCRIDPHKARHIADFNEFEEAMVNLNGSRPLTFSMVFEKTITIEYFLAFSPSTSMVFLSFHHWFQWFFNGHGPLVKRWNDCNGILGHYYKQCLSNMPLNPWSQSQINEHCAILCHEYFTIKGVHQHPPYHQYFAMNTLPWIRVLAIKHFGTWIHVMDTCHEYTLHRYLPWKDSNSIYAECHAMESSYEKVVLQCASFQICNNHFW